MFRLPKPPRFLVAAGVCALLFGGAAAHAQQAAPPPAGDTAAAPGRVARLAYLSGSTQFAPAGENSWGAAELNRPMVVGDRLVTSADGLAVVELGDASVRLDHESAFDFLNLDPGNVQVELSDGTLNAAVRELAPGENFEVDTPTVAFVATAPGIYRIDNNPDGTGSMVTVFQGAGTVYGENGASRAVAAGTSYRFNDSTLASVNVTGLPAPDDFDRFCEARDRQYQQYAQQSRAYVPQGTIGGDELSQYGVWGDVPQYGNVWYPNSVPVGWAPYRFGRWVWIDPWGWTWVDNQPWGFAPFHYGRWVYVANRWGWVPGPVGVRPVYAPAMVAFLGSGLSLSVGAAGGPVGWFPLGPRDVYVPWFAASQTYFNQVNITNVRVVNRTVINRYYAGYRGGRLPGDWQRNYAYRNMAGAVTAVPRNVFAGARPVHSAALRVNGTQLARARVAWRPGVDPGAASLGVGRGATRPTAVRGRAPFTRPIVARHRPAPQPVAFSARQPTIARQHGQPLTPTQLRQLQQARPTTQRRDQRVRLVPRAATAAAAEAVRRNEPAHPAQPPTATRTGGERGVATPRPGSTDHRLVGPGVPGMETVRPIQAPVNPAAGRGEALPSARFAHPPQSRTLPRAPVLRPGESAPAREPAGRLPVVQPIEAAPRAGANGVAAPRVPPRATPAPERQRETPVQRTPAPRAVQRPAAPRVQPQPERRAPPRPEPEQRVRPQQEPQRRAPAVQQERARVQPAPRAQEFRQRAPQVRAQPRMEPRPVNRAPQAVRQPAHPAEAPARGHPPRSSSDHRR